MIHNQSFRYLMSIRRRRGDIGSGESVRGEGGQMLAVRDVLLFFASQKKSHSEPSDWDRLFVTVD